MKKKLTPEQLAALDEANRAHVQRMRTDPAYAKEYNAEQERLRIERSEQWFRKQQEKTQHQLKHFEAIKEMDELLERAVDIAHRHGLMKDLRESWKAFTSKEEKEEDED